MNKTKNKYYNPNPLKKETSDCVIRAICKATDEDWDTVYRELCKVGFELKVMPNNDEAWKQYLINKGFIYHKVSTKRGTTRPTVDSFARIHKNGTYILRVAHHLVASVDGFYFDIFDSGGSSLYGYWEKPFTTVKKVM